MEVKIEKGQIVYLIENDSRGRGSLGPIETTVTKVGRLYFEIERCPHRRFKIENMLEDKDWGSKARVYLSMQEILDIQEFDRLSLEITDKFRGYGRLPYSTDQLKRVFDILNEPKQ